MNQEEKPQLENEEIDLMDYVKVLLKRRWLILAVLGGTVIVAGILSFLLPKIYKIDNSLEVGSISREAIESPEQLKAKIESGVYGILVRQKLNISEREYPKKKVENPKGTNLIKIEIQSKKSQMAKDILEEIDNLILKEHQEIINQKIILINQDIKNVEEQISLTESDIEKTQNKIAPTNEDIKRIENKIIYAEEEKENLEAKVDALQKILPYQQDPGTQFALFDTKEKLANKKQEIEDLYLKINSLRKTKEDLEMQINSLKATIDDLRSEINSLKASLDEIKPTEIIKKPTISEEPISPRPILNIVIAAVLGLFMGIFLAFGREWWEKSKL